MNSLRGGCLNEHGTNYGGRSVNHGGFFGGPQVFLIVVTVSGSGPEEVFKFVGFLVGVTSIFQKK